MARDAMNGRAATATFIGVFILFVVVSTVFAASGGVRGSDQFWYVADVETLLRTGAVTSETIFPVGLLGSGGDLSPAFIHVTLGPFLAAVPGVVLGPYWGWVALNIVATLGASLLIYKAARTVAEPWAAMVCAVAYPLLPVTFWHTSQPLTEASTAFFAALAIYALSIAGLRLDRWVAVAAATGLLYLSRESYLPLLLAIPVGYALCRWQTGWTGVRGAARPVAVLAVVVIGIVGLVQVVVPGDNVEFTYARLANAAIPGLTDNMWFNFDLSPANLSNHASIPWHLLPGKFLSNLTDQFVRFDSVPIASFFWTFDLLALVAVVMLWRTRHRPLELRLVVAALGFVAIHIVTIALFQNQVRYTVPALPGLLVVMSIALSGIPAMRRLIAPRLLLVTTLMLVAAAVPTIALANAQRQEGIAYGAVERATEALVTANLEPGEPLMMVYAGRPQVVAFGARERPILYVDADYSTDEFERLRASFRTDWLMAPLGSPAITGLGADASAPVGVVDSVDGSWGLFPLP